MRYLLIIPALATAALFSCTNSSKEPEHREMPAEMMQKGDYLPGIDLNSLASLHDSICGMSLKDGVKDTMQLGDMLIGFCSKGCKKAYAAKLENK